MGIEPPPILIFLLTACNTYSETEHLDVKEGYYVRFVMSNSDVRENVLRAIEDGKGWRLFAVQSVG